MLRYDGTPSRSSYQAERDTHLHELLAGNSLLEQTQSSIGHGQGETPLNRSLSASHLSGASVFSSASGASSSKAVLGALKALQVFF